MTRCAAFIALVYRSSRLPSSPHTTPFPPSSLLTTNKGYTDSNGEKKWMVVTQFEACDARRAFPCWDEPAKKSQFTAILRVPEKFTALSNMPVVSSTTEGGLNVVTFDKTPVMSTYLVAFAVGEFAYVESKTNSGITCRVYTNKGEESQGEFALGVAVKTLEFFHGYYDCPYALPKVMTESHC